MRFNLLIVCILCASCGAQPPPPFPDNMKRIIFYAPVSTMATFGSAEHANEICFRLANASSDSRIRERAGKFVAVLGSGSMAGGKFKLATAMYPYYLPDFTTQVAGNEAGLFGKRNLGGDFVHYSVAFYIVASNGSIDVSVTMDVDGKLCGDGEMQCETCVWTALDDDGSLCMGTAASSRQRTCNEYSGLFGSLDRACVGRMGMANSEWLSAYVTTCTARCDLYCAESDGTVRYPVPPAPSASPTAAPTAAPTTTTTTTTTSTTTTTTPREVIIVVQDNTDNGGSNQAGGGGGDGAAAGGGGGALDGVILASLAGVIALGLCGTTLFVCCLASRRRRRRQRQRALQSGGGAASATAAAAAAAGDTASARSRRLSRQTSVKRDLHGGASNRHSLNLAAAARAAGAVAADESAGGGGGGGNRGGRASRSSRSRRQSTTYKRHHHNSTTRNSSASNGTVIIHSNATAVPNASEYGQLEISLPSESSKQSAISSSSTYANTLSASVAATRGGGSGDGVYAYPELSAALGSGAPARDISTYASPEALQRDAAAASSSDTHYKLMGSPTAASDTRDASNSHNPLYDSPFAQRTGKGGYALGPAIDSASDASIPSLYSVPLEHRSSAQTMSSNASSETYEYLKLSAANDSAAAAEMENGDEGCGEGDTAHVHDDIGASSTATSAQVAAQFTEIAAI